MIFYDIVILINGFPQKKNSCAQIMKIKIFHGASFMSANWSLPPQRLLKMSYRQRRNRRETAKSSVIICDFTISRTNRRNLPNLAKVVQNVKFWASRATEEILRRSSDACSWGRLSVPAMSQLSARNRTNQLVAATSSWLPRLLLATAGGTNAGCVLHRSFCVAPSRDFEFNVIHGRTKSANNPRYCGWNLSQCACAATSHTIDPKAAKAWHQTALIRQPSKIEPLI